MLSYQKIERFLTKKLLQILRVFTIDNNIKFIELLYMPTAEMIILDLPTSLNIKPISNVPTHKLGTILIDNDSKDEQITRDIYDEIQLTVPGNLEENNFQSQLKHTYKKPISLTDINREDQSLIKNIKSQLERFKLSVEHLPYKFVILLKNYLCFLNSKNSIECYRIKHFVPDYKHQLFILTDMENLHNSNNISNDLTAVKKGLYEILNSNQHRQMNTLEQMINKDNIFENFSYQIEQTKIKYSDYIKKLTTLLKAINSKESSTLDIVERLRQNNEFSSVGSYENTLRNLQSTKIDIISNLQELRKNEDDLFLFADKFMFENTIMINSIINNLKRAKTYYNNLK